MLTQAILAAVLMMPAAGPKVPYATGLIPMSRKQLVRLKSKGLDFGSFSKGMKAVPPPKYELKWMPRPVAGASAAKGSKVTLTVR